MFGLNWSEIALIGVVALIAIGPKDMPVAIRAITDIIKKLRRMAGEFQGHVDEMMREANLGEMRDGLNELRSLDVRGRLARAIDPDRSLRGAFDDPFRAHPVPPVVPMTGARPAPDFIPPGAEPPAAIQPVSDMPPAFIPPEHAAVHPSWLRGE